MKQQLLTREEFRRQVFARDNNKCVFCGEPAVDAHHIIERRLWSDGGYYLDNGASVCEHCHYHCEATDFEVDHVRQQAGITKPIIPEHLYDDVTYDKWGNIILGNGDRLKGELFYDQSVQKVLGQKVALFSNHVKYPRTYHLPWSDGMNDDDRQMKDVDNFIGKRVVVTEKMDGENTTMYSDYIHARSLNNKPHITRDWVKQFWSERKYDIPEGYRICGENLYGKHSISYDTLLSYFMGFSFWDEHNICLSWDTTIEWFDLLGITPVPVLFDGMFDIDAIKSLKLPIDKHEGYVVRLASAFTYGDFRRSVGKFVRKDHVNTVKHWLYGAQIEQNGLLKDLHP